LEGRALELLGWKRRRGTLELTLVLPDGSKSLIPAAWTDLEPRPEGEVDRAQALGSVADLLHARTILAPLLARLEATDRDDPRQSSEEVARAAAPGPGGGPAPPVAVWEGLTAEQQAAVVGLLARLIAKTLAAGETDDA
jgi:hypothetical protein